MPVCDYTALCDAPPHFIRSFPILSPPRDEYRSPAPDGGGPEGRLLSARTDHCGKHLLPLGPQSPWMEEEEDAAPQEDQRKDGRPTRGVTPSAPSEHRAHSDTCSPAALGQV